MPNFDYTNDSAWETYLKDSVVPLNESADYLLRYHQEIKNIFIVIPNKVSLLSKELMYTALSRSTNSVTLFLQESKGENALEVARRRSFILPRMTSIFDPPEDYKRVYEPKKGEPVQSKIEYILYKALESRGLEFGYEQSLEMKKEGGGIATIHPDFTIKIGDTEYYWEHLGQLDLKNYSTDWKERKDLYAANGLLDRLITSDDLNGVRDEIVSKLIDDIRTGRPVATTDPPFSKHHYKLN